MVYLEQDKFSEQLVSKLCARIRSSGSEKEAINASYCLTLLSISDSAIKKLLSCFNDYRDKLEIEQVYSNFKNIMQGKVRSFSLWLEKGQTGKQVALRRVPGQDQELPDGGLQERRLPEEETAAEEAEPEEETERVHRVFGVQLLGEQSDERGENRGGANEETEERPVHDADRRAQRRRVIDPQ